MEREDPNQSLVCDALTHDALNAVAVFDAELRYVAVSEAARVMMGFPNESFVGRRPSEVFPPESALPVEEGLRDVIKGGKPVVVEYALRLHGADRMFHSRRTPLRDATGRVTGLVVVTRDVTAERLAERTGALFREVLALFLKASCLPEYGDALLGLLASRLPCRSLGLRVVDRARGTLSFVASRGFSEGFLRAAGALPVDSDEPQALASREGFRTHGVFPVRRGDELLGCLHLADVEADKLTAEDVALVGSLLPLIGEAMGRFWMEDALSDNRVRLAALVDALPLAIWYMDEDRRVRFQNAAHRTAFGEAHAGDKCHLSMMGSAVPCDDCPMERVRRGETVRKAGWRSPRNDRSYDVLNVPMNLGGEFGHLEILIDATERAMAEMHLRETQRLESLGSLAAGVAHDFNNILAGIIGYSQLGEQRAGEQEDLADPFRQIHAVADRGAELTRKILAFSRRQPLRMAPLDSNALIEGLDVILRPLLGNLVTVRNDLGNPVWAVMGDRGQLEQVLFNLCVNAVEAMPAGGMLTLATRNVDPVEMARLAGNGGAVGGVEFRVTDTGTGMPPEVVQHAFEPFFTTKGRGRGTGLGLSVTYGIVQQHGGKILIDSVPGAGTTMSVLLPASSITPSRIPRKTTPAPVQARKCQGRALVVEDERAIRELVTSLLRQVGFEVDAACDGAEALLRMCAPGARFDVVVTDIAMPGINGYELSRRIDAIRPGTPFVFMTGCADTTLEQYGVGNDVRLLHKPFSLPELVRMVEEAVGNGDRGARPVPPGAGEELRA